MGPPEYLLMENSCKMQGEKVFIFSILCPFLEIVFLRLLIHVNAAIENKSTMNAQTVSQHVFDNKTAHNKLQLCILFNILFKMHQ